MKNIGAYFQCYKNPKATYYCLENFRRHYPDSTIVLVSDNGYNYTELANYFRCIYIHDTVSSRYIYTIDDVKNGSHIESMNHLINRVKQAFMLCNEEYIMWLEDDVRVNRQITDEFRYDLNGFCPNSIFPHAIQNLSNKYPNLERKNYVFSGHGGSVYRRTALLESFENKNCVDDLLVNWLQYGFNEMAQDLLFSTLLILNNKTIGPYNGHGDCSGEDTHFSVQHQYKKYYT